MKRFRAKERQTSLPARRGGISILDAIRDARLFGPWFAKKPESWAAWLTFLAALFALEMTPAQLQLYRKCTGRKQPPSAVNPVRLFLSHREQSIRRSRDGEERWKR